MKVFSIALALTALASAAPVGAQILGSRLPTPTTTRGSSIDGSWYEVGRDASGYAIYERRVRDANGNIIIQRARRDANGNMTIISSRTASSTSGRNRTDCDYNRTTNSVGDIIFGRTSNVYCDDRYSRVDGGWYQVGRGPNNNSVYERRTRDANGNLVIQKARRNSDGTFRILSTRYANDNDKQWRKAQKQQQKEWRKEQKRYEKGNGHGKGNRGDRY
ncbi:MAG TPA: hypothetical protein VK494_01085 [Gemmatimonadaceae bacterium]|jgi:hypothetical protein|nr:hypothetical protein [Gemmatimonadaceae bacterium]